MPKKMCFVCSLCFYSSRFGVPFNIVFAMLLKVRCAWNATVLLVAAAQSSHFIYLLSVKFIYVYLCVCVCVMDMRDLHDTDFYVRGSHSRALLTIWQWKGQSCSQRKKRCFHKMKTWLEREIEWAERASYLILFNWILIQTRAHIAPYFHTAQHSATHTKTKVPMFL